MLAALLVSTLLASGASGQINWKHPSGNPVTLVDGGLCVGLAWVKLLPGEVATVDYGPDFNVYRVHGPGDAEWGAYSGTAGQSSPDAAHPLLRKNGVTVYRGVGTKGFDGYFIGQEDHGISEQNHFFGTVFKDALTDMQFFSRVTFGSAARAKCESHPTK